ncbi:MAG: site-specific recombinase, partial [Burkholderiaceae bacterium]|nr:site-specific recombinase [Burkholderiaceae bacterium]
MSEWTAQARQRLAAMDADAPMALRHVWLVETVQWIRGEEADVPAALRRVEALLDGAEADPEWRERWTLWWSRFTQAVDVAPLLADYGFASRQAFWSELGHRLRRKCLPASPQTTDVGELFALVFADPK